MTTQADQRAHQPARRVLVTGASSGIGAATATLLAERGWYVLAVARRKDKLDELATHPQIDSYVCDITHDDEVAALASWVEQGGGLDVLINNAGGAIGMDSVEGGSIDEWRWMYEINVLGTKRMISTFLPMLRKAADSSGGADILTVTSTAGFTPYEGGGGYNAAKYAAHAMMQVLRLELNGEPIRVIDIAPGMVKTDEFALNRFRGDSARSQSVYANVDRPLLAEDVALTIASALELPAHVNLDLVTVKPVAQSAQHKTHRGPLRTKPSDA
ncbi:SDR family oxidoreductase [Pontimonas salivibrio]|uniref:SDR family oxidoreductase n=1 Tax=Pontimonas salivibrio TaxID=1159327 RepID=UPI001FEACA4B|nr:SDR family oxidoreductase [Pontimonas salivibrio]